MGNKNVATNRETPCINRSVNNAGRLCIGARGQMATVSLAMALGPYLTGNEEP